MKRVKQRLGITFVAFVVLSSVLIITPNMMPKSKATTFFYEDFEPSPMPGWTTMGYWHLVNDTTDPCVGAPGHPNSSYSPNHSYAYHIDATCDYDDGNWNFGSLQSPPFDLTGATQAYLHIRMWYHTEQGNANDLKWIFISLDGFSWEVLGQIADINGDPMGTWFVEEFNISKYAGIPNIYLLFKFDTFSAGRNYYAGWYIDDIIIDDSPIYRDALMVEAWNRAPESVEVGFGELPMLQLNLSTYTNSIKVTSIRINLSGLPPNPSDIAKVELWWDFGNDILEPGDDGLLDSKTPPFPIVFDTSLDVSPPHPYHLFVVFSIPSGATPGDWIGVSMADSTYITVEDGDVVSPANFPIDTYVPGERTQIVSSNSDTLIVEDWNRAPEIAEQGESEISMLQLNLSASANIIRLNSLEVVFSGSPDKPSNLGKASLYVDSDGNDLFEPGIDEWLGTESPPPYTFSFTLWVTPETTVKLFVVLTISSAATVGDWVGIKIPTSSSIGISDKYGIDKASPSDFPIDTYVPGNRTQIVAPTVDTLTVVYWEAKNPPTVEQGTSNVLMVSMTLEANSNSVTLWSMDIDMKGTFATLADVSTAKIYHDVDNNGFLDLGIDEFLTQNQLWLGTPPTTTLWFIAGNGFKVTTGTPENLLIVYDFTPAANVGDFIGVSLVNETYINLRSGSIDVVAPTGFPIETSPDTEIVASSPDILTAAHWKDVNPPDAAQGAQSILMTNMTLEVNANSVTVKSIDIDLKGNPTSATDISSVEIYHDRNNNGLYESGIDELLGFGAFSQGSPPKATVILGTLGFTVSNSTPENLLIVYDISIAANPGDFVGVSMLDKTYFNLFGWSIDSVASTNFPIETSPDTEITAIGNITGRIIDKNGEGLEGAAVSLYNSIGDFIATTITSETGWFTFIGLEPATDEYTVEVTMTNYISGIVENIDVVANTTIDIGAITLQTNGTISGKVLDNNGKDITNAKVELLDEDGNVVKNVYTNENGNYTFEGVGYGTYKIRVKAVGYQEYTTSETYIIDKNNLNVVVSDISLTVTPSQFNWLWIVLLIVVIGVVISFVFFFTKKRKKKEDS